MYIALIITQNTFLTSNVKKTQEVWTVLRVHTSGLWLLQMLPRHEKLWGVRKTKAVLCQKAVLISITGTNCTQFMHARLS